MIEFADFIKSKVFIQEADLQLILDKFKVKTVEKGQFILKRGQIANQYFYIRSGA